MKKPKRDEFFIPGHPRLRVRKPKPKYDIISMKAGALIAMLTILAAVIIIIDIPRL